MNNISRYFLVLLFLLILTSVSSIKRNIDDPYGFKKIDQKYNDIASGIINTSFARYEQHMKQEYETMIDDLREISDCKENKKCSSFSVEKMSEGIEAIDSSFTDHYKTICK